MATVTLTESAKLSQDMLLRGVIENVITVDKFFEVLPFSAIHGNSLAYNRENALGDVGYTAAGATITAKAAATFTQVTSSLVTIVGDAEVDGLIQATRSNINDQRAVQIASKAKNLGRTYRNTLINGTGGSNDFSGLLALVAAGQTISSGTNGANLSFANLDQLLDTVVDKDGEVDYMIMPSRTIRSYFALLRAQGGAGIGETMTLPSGATVPTYRGVPIFRNDYVPTNQTKGTATTATSVIAGTLDDGSNSIGIAGLTAEGSAGIRHEFVGLHQSADMTIDRVKWYAGLANFSEKGLAILDGVLD